MERFEDLVAWQKARILARAIYKVTAEGSISKDFSFRDQIRRAAVSIMSNIAEGFERWSASEFHQFPSIAKGSCAELRSLLYLAYDIGYLSDEVFNQLLEQAEEVKRLITSLRKAIRTNHNRSRD